MLTVNDTYILVFSHKNYICLWPKILTWSRNSNKKIPSVILRMDFKLGRDVFFCYYVLSYGAKFPECETKILCILLYFILGVPK